MQITCCRFVTLAKTGGGCCVQERKGFHILRTPDVAIHPMFAPSGTTNFFATITTPQQRPSRSKIRSSQLTEVYSLTLYI